MHTFHHCEGFLCLLWWRHMSVMLSKITCLSSAYATTYMQVNITENMKAPHFWTFVCGKKRWPTNPPHKGPVIRKAYLCHCVCMDLCQRVCFSIYHELNVKKLQPNLWYKPHLSYNKPVDHSDVVGVSPVGDAPTTSSFSTNTWLQWIGQRQLQEETRII